MIVFSDSPLEIGRDAGVECIVCTAEDVGISLHEIINFKF